MVPLACEMEKVEPENESGPEKPVACTAPAPLVERSVELKPRFRLVVEAVEK